MKGLPEACCHIPDPTACVPWLADRGGPWGATCSASPFSTCTSIIFFSRVTLAPLQFSQRSLGLMRSPWPLHSMHTVWICCTMPGPICWMWICMPRPLHRGHFSTDPFFPPMPVEVGDKQKSCVPLSRELPVPLGCAKRPTLINAMWAVWKRRAERSGSYPDVNI